MTLRRQWNLFTVSCHETVKHNGCLTQFSWHLFQLSSLVLHYFIRENLNFTCLFGQIQRKILFKNIIFSEKIQIQYLLILSFESSAFRFLRENSNFLNLIWEFIWKYQSLNFAAKIHIQQVWSKNFGFCVAARRFKWL